MATFNYSEGWSQRRGLLSVIFVTEEGKCVEKSVVKASIKQLR